MAFYIHIADPGFPDPPWPGVRRLGPYPTMEEAQAQAASDASLGMGVALGVFEEAESATSASEGGTATPVVSPETIIADAEVLADERNAQTVAVAREMNDLIEQRVPGVTVEGLREAGLLP